MAKRGLLRKNLAVGGKIPLYYAVSVIFAAMYLFGHINQVRLTLMGNGLINVTNLMMCALGVAESLIPVMIVLGKSRALKANLYLIGILYLCGNLWFLRWLYVQASHLNNISYDFAAYQKMWGYMFNHTIWASRNAETLLLNYFSAMLWFSIAKNIDKDKHSTVGSMILVIVVTFILPAIFFAATRYRIISVWWIKKSITLFISYICILVVMGMSMQKKTFWTRYVCRLKVDLNDRKRHHNEF